MSNHLIHETSPYLLQHAHNPVNWYPWGGEALQKAKEEDKPILVSIGYAACHWCHVMERESFEDPATAAIMNEHFVNIKIDREERPDLDHIYMDAVQSMTGSGGWPLNVFLTPDKEPFYGGTYFPPRRMANRPSWTDVLLGVAGSFVEKRAEIEQQANRLTEHLSVANLFGINDAHFEQADPERADIACNHLLKQADMDWGGFGKAPKFPQTFSTRFLLRYYHFEQERPESHAATALQAALLSLDKMIDGGIYDQVGGGFARYSTDTQWLAPHFEKMLYDNALLVSAMSEACQVTRKDKYRRGIEETLSFVERELMHPQKGFYAALDADSEGEEGKFYVWDFDEIHQVLQEDAHIFCEYYDISPAGNWEGKNILRVLQPIEAFARQHAIPQEELAIILDRGRKKLLALREQRIRPALDDKIILGWNALMNKAYSMAYAATGNDHYREVAIENMHFLLQAFSSPDGGLTHVWKNGVSKFPAFLDDYASLVQALLQLHRITGDTKWLDTAASFCEKALASFSGDNDYFYYTPAGQQDVIIRKVEIYDGATPSGNGLMAQNLLELGILLERDEWKQRSERMVSGLTNMVTKYPTSFGCWLMTMYQQLKGSAEITLLGDVEQALPQMLQLYIPHSVIMSSATENTDYPLLRGKKMEQPLSIYLCENYSCKAPVFSVADFKKMV